MIEVIVPVLIAFAVAYLATPWVMRLANRWGAVDAPNERKVHTHAMPRMGGLAIYAGFAAALLLTQPLSMPMIGILAGGTLIVLLGIVDDIRGISPKVKLLGQTAAALIVVFSGITVSFVTNPFADVLFLKHLAIPVTILWIVGVTNAINLIDGLDGLAAGTSGIAAVTIALVAALEGHGAVAVMAIVMAGAIFGFLPHNFNPAKIFMGDTGSMLLGFVLSVLAIIGLTKSATVISLFVPVVILGIPIFDTAFAIVRRSINRAPIFQADKAHLHHQLLDMGLSHRQTVLTIYVINLCLGASAVMMSLMAPPQAVILLIGVTVSMILGMNHLSFSVVAKKQQKTGVDTSMNGRS